METFGGYEHRSAFQYTNPSFKIVHTVLRLSEDSHLVMLSV